MRPDGHGFEKASTPPASGHDHGDEDGHDHASELPVYLFTAADVTLHGLEAQFNWQINDPFKLTLQGDYIRARLNDGGDLPRTPPLRMAAELAYEHDAISADVRATRYFKQDNVSELEQATAGYTLLDASVSYRFELGDQQHAGLRALHGHGQHVQVGGAAIHVLAGLHAAQ